MFKIASSIDLMDLEEEVANSYLGFVYVFEHGENVKIGCTSQPHTRYRTLKSNAEKYGNVKTGKFLVSIKHSNYQENERKLHEFFKEFRINRTELFKISLDDVMWKLAYLKLFFDDDSENIKRDAVAFGGLMGKSAVYGIMNTTRQNQNVKDFEPANWFIENFCEHLTDKEKKYVLNKFNQKKNGDISGKELAEVIFWVFEKYDKHMLEKLFPED